MLISTDLCWNIFYVSLENLGMPRQPTPSFDDVLSQPCFTMLTLSDHSWLEQEKNTWPVQTNQVPALKILYWKSNSVIWSFEVVILLPCSKNRDVQSAEKIRRVGHWPQDKERWKIIWQDKQTDTNSPGSQGLPISHTLSHEAPCSSYSSVLWDPLYPYSKPRLLKQALGGSASHSVWTKNGKRGCWQFPTK